MHHAGELNAVMSTSSRALQAMGRYGALPSHVSHSSKKFVTPVAAIVIQSVTTACMMQLSYPFLVVLDTLFNNISLVFEIASFLYLKHKRPDLERPYEVPGKLIGAWVITIPKAIVLLYAFWSVGLSLEWLIAAVFNVLFAAAGALWLRHRRQKRLANLEENVIAM